MRINGQGPDAQLKLYQNKDVKAAGPAGDAKRRAVERDGDSLTTEDRIALSSRAKEAAMAAELARTAPDIRSQRLADLKNAIDSGQYKVHSEELAEKIIKEALISP